MATIIAFVDDQKSHFDSLKDYIDGICDNMGVDHKVIHVQAARADIDESTEQEGLNGRTLTTRDKIRQALIAKIERLLENCHREGTRVILIFDNLIQAPGGPFRMEHYVRTLWHAPVDTWRGQVPIIVWATNTDTTVLKTLGTRPRSQVISGTPTVGDLGLQSFEDAVRDALR